jgi:hypothetical protein
MHKLKLSTSRKPRQPDARITITKDLVVVEYLNPPTKCLMLEMDDPRTEVFINNIKIPKPV